MRRMKDQMQVSNGADRLDGIEIPLKNIEFTIQQYLMANGTRLDTDTRVLLAGVRDCVGRVAAVSREYETPTAKTVDLHSLPSLLAG